MAPMLRERLVVYQSVLRPVERRSDGRSRRPAARRLQDPVSQCWQRQSVERVIGHFGFNRPMSAFGGKADIPDTRYDVCFRPKAKIINSGSNIFADDYR
jgi:hypothetical protein